MEVEAASMSRGAVAVDADVAIDGDGDDGVVAVVAEPPLASPEVGANAVYY